MTFQLKFYKRKYNIKKFIKKSFKAKLFKKNNKWNSNKIIHYTNKLFWVFLYSYKILIKRKYNV